MRNDLSLALIDERWVALLIDFFFFSFFFFSFFFASCENTWLLYYSRAPNPKYIITSSKLHHQPKTCLRTKLKPHNCHRQPWLLTVSHSPRAGKGKVR